MWMRWRDAVTAVQNERQPRNSAQVRQDQLEAELQHGGSEHGSVGCGVGPGLMTGATVSATHPAFAPVRPTHDGPSAAVQQHRCGTANNDAERRNAGHKADSEHGQQLTSGTLQQSVLSVTTKEKLECHHCLPMLLYSLGDMQLSSKNIRDLSR